MPSYVNPPGAPPVMFAGPVQFTRDEVAAACRRWGSSLWLKPEMRLDGPQVLWALAGVESGFGANCRPRHESGYCTGRYSATPLLQALTQRLGHAAHCSFGPWQVMLANLGISADPASFDTAADCARIAAGFINTNILQRQGATTLQQIADAYNSGTWRDANVPSAYVAAAVQHYGEPMPAPRVLPA